MMTTRQKEADMRIRIGTLLAALALCLLGARGFAHTTYTGYSGAPGSKGYCASSCHGSAGGSITVSGFPSEYIPGQSYNITVSHTGGSPIKQFNGSCRIGVGSTNAGVIAAGTGTATYNTTGETNGVHLSSSDLDNGTFSWTAPAGGTGDVTLYIAGHQGSASGPNTEISLVATEFATGVSDDGTSVIPDHFSLGNNYPNPFNPTTAIAFNLPLRSHVTIDVFNLLGRRVATLTDEDYSAGNHTVTWDGTSSDGHTVSTGIYMYRIEAGDFVQTKKMLLLK
jgi:hypothetical protein